MKPTWSWAPGPAAERLARALIAAAADGHLPPCGRWADDPPWTSDDADQRKQAALLCVSCPLAGDCHAAAVEARESWGVWGGVDFSNRTKKGQTK